MGVAGAGKTAVGSALATRLRRHFVDADDLHPASNVEKMRAGTPLDDTDRAPWLDRVGETLAGDATPVVACSALKRMYRDRLRQHAPTAMFVLLDGTRAVIAERMAARRDHFMPLSLLDDQLGTLEPLAGDEPGLTVGIVATVDEIVAAISAGLER